MRNASRIRLPFLGVFLIAAAGCAAGHFSPFSPFLPGCIAFLLLLLCTWRGAALAFWPAVFLTFFALQSGQQQWAGSRLLLESLAENPRVLTLSGVVAEPPKALGAAWSFPLSLREGRQGDSLPSRLNGLVHVRWRGNLPQYGDLVQIRGVLEPIAEPRNPGSFDFARWLRLKGIWAEIRPTSPADGIVLASGLGNPVLALAWKTRERIALILGEGISQFPEVRALVLAMTLGTTEAVSEKLMEEFRVTGTLHLFSVSGLHVGMLAVLLWLGLKPLRLPFPVHVVVIILLLFFYAAVTGLRPASVRAAFMAAVVLGGLLLARPATPLNSLAAAGFFLLLADSAQIFNPGFQLSFTVVGAILLIGSPIAKWLREHCGPDSFLPVKLYGPRDKIHSWLSREAGALAAVSASAWLGSLPLIAVYYNLVSLSALPVNMVAVPIAFGILAVAVLSLVGGVFFPLVAAVFNHTNVLLCSALVGLIQFAAAVPGSSIRIADPFAFRADLHAVFFDFGAGESTAIAGDGGIWLVDTGSSRDWKQTVAPWLARGGYQTTSGLFLTHGDARHIGGAADAIASFPPDFVAVAPAAERSPTLRRLYWEMEERSLPRRIIYAGMAWQVSPSWWIEVLYPPPRRNASPADERAVVTRWSGGGASILLLGDAGIGAQQWLVENSPNNLRADILVLGRPATGELVLADFLEHASPRAIIVSAADFPSREQFSPLWEEGLSGTQATIFRKDQSGAVLLDIRPDLVTLRSFIRGGPSATWKRENPSFQP